MSRRTQIQLSDQEIHDFLKSSRTMILVSNGKNGWPHPMPMWFWVDDDNNIFMTTFRKSQKVNNIKRDPRVTLLVESGDAYQELKSVVIYAEAEVVDDLDYTTEIMFNLSAARGEVDAGQADAVKGPMQRSASKRVVLRFNPKKIVSWDHAKLGGVY